MSDLISRQRAIDEISRWLGYLDDDMILRIQIGLRKLPSEQPVATDTNVGDTISRQAAIDALHMHLMYRMGTDSNKKRLDEWINNLPSAEPEQPTEVQDILQYLDEYLHPIVSPEHWSVYSELYDMVSMLQSSQPEQRWIPCSERLPDNRVDVLICYRVWQQYAKRYVYAIVNGWYARKHSVNENVFSEWEGDCDYKEDEDEFYIQEGWYEFTTQGNGDLMNWYIGGAEVVAWMPLPKPYKEGVTT